MPIRLRPVPLLLAALLFVALPLASARAESRGFEPVEAAAVAQRRDPDFAEARALEDAAFRAEREDAAVASARFRRAAALYESIAEARTEPVGRSRAYWRSARAYWRAADTLPQEASEPQLELYRRAESLSQAGIEAHPDCAECMLWKFSSIGRQSATGGVWAARRVAEMAALLDRGIALSPTYVEDADHSTLSELHYSSAILYRVMPDWRMVSWLIGVRGDRERSLAHIRTALSLHPHNLEYQVELGSQLACRGSTRDDAAQLAEGRDVLQRAVVRTPKSLDDEREIEAARIMLDAPDRACDYSGSGWIELEQEES